MAHDRVRADRLPLTHKSLALNLSVRRAGVTEALHGLSRESFSAIGRGAIIVLDRQGLERTAKCSYGIPEAEFRRLFDYDVGLLPNDMRIQADRRHQRQSESQGRRWTAFDRCYVGEPQQLD